MAGNKEEVQYVVNNAYCTYKINDIVFPRQRFCAVTAEQLAALNKFAVFASLVATKTLEVRAEVDDSMKTTEELLQEAKSDLTPLTEENAALKTEIDSIKQEAIDEIKKRDDEIAALKAQLAKNAKSATNRQ